MSRVRCTATAVVILLALFATAAMDEAEGPVSVLDDEEQAIRVVMEDLVRGYEREDIEAWARNLADDPGMINIGVGANHYFVGWEELKRGLETEWAVVSDTKITVSDLKITVLPDGSHAWTTCKFVWQANAGGQTLSQACRQTAIFEKREGKWIVVHFHDSVGIGGE